MIICLCGTCTPLFKWLQACVCCLLLDPGFVLLQLKQPVTNAKSLLAAETETYKQLTAPKPAAAAAVPKAGVHDAFALDPVAVSGEGAGSWAALVSRAAAGLSEEVAAFVNAAAAGAAAKAGAVRREQEQGAPAPAPDARGGKKCRRG